MYRIVAIYVMVICCCCTRAAAFPDHLLHQPYAVQYEGIDSIHRRINEKDSATAYHDIEQLKKWAVANNDKPMLYGLQLIEYAYSFRASTINNGYIETGLPALVKVLEAHKLLQLHAQALDMLANYYWQNPRKYSDAFDASFAAYNIYSRLSLKDFPLKYECYYNLGLAYYRFKDYRSAVNIFLEVNKASAAHSPEPVSLLNTIGLCYRRSLMYDSAEYYFQKGYDQAKNRNQLGWVGIIGGNLGITYYLRKKYTEAIPLLEYDISTCLDRNKLSDNAANSLAILADIYLETGNKEKGMALLQQAYREVTDGHKWRNYELLESIYPRLAKAYALTGDYKAAYNFADSAKRVQDSSVSQRNAVILAGAQQKSTVEKHMLEVQKHERETRIQVLIWVFLLVSITLLVIAVFFIYNNYANQKRTNILLSKEKKRSEDLLLNILPAEVADELKDKGSAEVKYFDHVTVMFTDFVNFTQASERMNPQQLIDELHTCFKAFDTIIGKYNIEKIKTIGDAYLAVSGLPVPAPQHAEHILSAAMEIRDFMRKRGEQLGNKTFQIRIGIHSGSVVAGIVGVTKFAYDIWGDTVNIAARMEQSSAEDKINISQSTYDLVKHKFSCTYRGAISAKNKGELNMYFVEGIPKLHAVA